MLVAVGAAEAALVEARAHLLVADREAGDTIRPGDRSFEAAHARSSRSGVVEATRAVRQADALVSMATVAAGVRDGSMPLPHLDALARVAATASPEVASVLRAPSVRADVVQLARIQSAPDFAKSLARYVAAKDPAALDRERDAQHGERFFSMSAQPNGVFLKGRLDRVAGEALRVALDAMGQFGDDTRSAGQASADALTMLAERVCAGTGAVPARAGGAEPDGASLSGTVGRAHLSLIVPAPTFAELLAHHRARDAADTARPDVPAWSPVVPATLEDGTPVSMSELARALCDCEITRVVMTAEGVPLDLGRTKRLFSAAQRRAVVARDRECIWNGCEQPASRCEVHHIRWWDRDRGSTSVANAALSCKHHHGEIHRQDLSIERLVRPPDRDGGPGWPEPSPRDEAFGREPVRYVFRNRRGDIVNAPAGTNVHAPAGTNVDHPAGADVNAPPGADTDVAAASSIVRDAPSRSGMAACPRVVGDAAAHPAGDALFEVG